ncbi:hypothetical protein, partial [Caldifermentibacillus hisashii]|uniref:hypothetical protein n=1 Tax=Caldifermentibacillus hisashii TaxID=996558 RepID=UPI0015956FED
MPMKEIDPEYGMTPRANVQIPKIKVARGHTVMGPVSESSPISHERSAQHHADGENDFNGRQPPNIVSETPGDLQGGQEGNRGGQEKEYRG